MKNSMWVSFDVLEWRADLESSTVYGDENWKRAYDIWSHAEQILKKPAKDLDLVDAITTLKRAIDHRLRHLNELYSFKTMPIKDKPSGLLELLFYFEIIRPIMLQRLIAIRNEVEHQDASPPSQSVCKEFLEFTWYFLRSTDQLVKSVTSSLLLIPFGENLIDYDYWLNVDINPKKGWVVQVCGWLYPSLVSQAEKDNWIKLEIEKIDTRKDFFKGASKKEKNESGRGKNQKDIYILLES